MLNCPLSTEKADRLVKQLELTNGCYVVDIGCGEGEFLIRVAEQYDVAGVGLYNNSDLIELANRKVKERISSNSVSVSFVCQDARSFNWNRHTDLMICLGSEFILGGYRQALPCLSHCLVDEGMLLVGTIFWQQEPYSEYLSLMGGENVHFDYLTTVDIAIEEGFVPLYLCRSNEDE